MLVAATWRQEANRRCLSHERRSVWVPTFAGTTAGVVAACRSHKNKKPALPPAFVRSALTPFTHDPVQKPDTHFSGSCARSVRRFQRRLLLLGNRALDG